MFDVASIIEYGGLLLVFLAVFCQTGLFFCFFLPSGGLLFASGVFVANGTMDHSIVSVCVVLALAAVLGNASGYGIGRKAGLRFQNRKDSRLFRKAHLQKAEAFYQRYGSASLVASPFFPLVRTFVPIAAGMVGVPFRRFVALTAIGSIAWISVFVLAGFFVAKVPALKPYTLHLALGVVALVGISLLGRLLIKRIRVGRLRRKIQLGESTGG